MYLTSSILALSMLLSSGSGAGADTISQLPSAAIDTTSVIDRDLQDLVVIAKKDLVKSDGSKVTYDMANDDTSKGQTLLDAIRKVPMVTVDGDDNIYINGNSSIRIYVNGKADPMLTSNYQKIFKSMPAASVSKIEVLTEPGAKYDAEGTGGILNLIIERKQKRDGYSGSISASLNNRNYYFNGYAATKFNNFSIDASATYMHSLNNNGMTGKEETVNFTDYKIYRQTREREQNFCFGYGDVNLNMSWEPNDKNLFTWGGSFNSMNGNAKKMTILNKNFSANNELIQQSDQKFSGSMNQLSASANASYQHTFGKRNHNLIISYLFNYGKNPFHIYSDNLMTTFSAELADSNNSTDNIATLEQRYFSSNLMNNYIREHTAQIDYSLPFGKEDNQTFEAGGKYVTRHNSNYSYTQMGPAMDNLQNVQGQDVSMNQNQNIGALYATYSGTFSKWNIRGGVRYEHTDMGIEDLTKKTKFWNSLNDVVPDAALTYMFSHSSNLRLSYQMRISRPSLNQVSPYQMNIMDDYVQTGNPDLSSEKRNTIGLKYTNFAGVLGGNVGIEYSQTDNAIQHYTYWKDGVQYETYANVGTHKSLNLNGFLMINLNQKMSINLSGNVSYVNIKASNLGLKNHGWGGGYNVNWNYTGPAEIKYAVYGGQNVHMINLTGYFSGWYYYGISLSRDFLKDKKLNISLNASNFLTSHTFFKSYTYAPTYKSVSSNKRESWVIGATLTWRFGNSESKAKKTSKQINNDDTNNSDNSKGGGGISL